MIGHIYIAEFGHAIKIGRSITPERRIRTLETQSGKHITQAYISPLISNYKKAETQLHHMFKENRILGEYFEVTFEEAVRIFKTLDFEVVTEEIQKAYRKQEKEHAEKSAKALAETFCPSIIVEKQDWSLWEPTKDEIELVINDLKESVEFCIENDEIIAAEEEQRYKEAIENTTGHERKTLIQRHLAFAYECTPRDALGEIYEQLFVRALGITKTAVLITEFKQEEPNA